ncbi:MAG: hypothetical protein IJ017_05970 [Oscillospiraceae bacterium]|nr:hypothetical protein [Oscillospiraceae bacterium]
MELMERQTEELINTLKKMDISELGGFFEENFSGGEPDFYKYIDGILKEKELKRQDVIIRANFSQKYGYKLLSGEAHTTDRDKIIRLCFSMELTLKETQRALRLYGLSELYPKVKRDALLITALGRKIFDIDTVNELLQKEGCPSLYNSGEE